jgi:hypothetical protein
MSAFAVPSTALAVPGTLTIPTCDHGGNAWIDPRTAEVSLMPTHGSRPVEVIQLACYGAAK